MNEEQVCEHCGSSVCYVSEYVVKCEQCGQYAEAYSADEDLLPMEKIRRRASKEDAPEYE